MIPSLLSAETFRAVAAGVLSAPLLFNSPGGHQILYEASLRIAIAGAHDFARDYAASPDMSFAEFEAFAPFYLDLYYAGDREKWEKALVQLSASTCLPPENGGDGAPQQNYAMACHAPGRSDDEEDEMRPLA